MGAWIVGGWARKSIFTVVRRTHVDQTVSTFFGNLVRWTVLVLGLVACLSIFGINIAAVAAVIGAAGLAIGLAMQGSLANLAAGIMLLILRPFRLGDAIVVAGQSGKVNEIDLFNTKLDTADNRRLIIPNSAVFGATIENSTHHPKRRVDVMVRTPFQADVERTREILLAAASGVPRRLADEPVEASLADIGNTGLVWAVRLWCATDDAGVVRDALVTAVKSGLERASITIPNGP